MRVKRQEKRVERKRGRWKMMIRRRAEEEGEQKGEQDKKRRRRRKKRRERGEDRRGRTVRLMPTRICPRSGGCNVHTF